MSTTGVRRTLRVKCQKRSYSPQPEVKRLKKRRVGVRRECKDYDINPSNGQKFECDECFSNFIIDPSKRKAAHTKYKPTPRYREHPETGRILTLCNRCGLRFDRQPDSPQKRASGVTEEDKATYEKESKQFVSALKQRFHTAEVEKLVCPNMNWKICGCIQTYIMGNEQSVNTEGASGRVQLLLSMSREAHKLSQLKHHITSNQASNSSIPGRVGLGNGRKKSVLFHEYVLREREHLRQVCGLCERGAQCLLGYSNNLLYRKLKTDQNKSRLQPRIGKGAKQLVEIDELSKQSCCSQACVQLAHRQPLVVEEWRSRALLSQADTGLVIAEMLTPAAGSHRNCMSFITMVTGACPVTISKVHAHLRRTGGDKQPPEHGLRKFHLQEQSKAKSRDNAPGSPASPDPTHNPGVERSDSRQQCVSSANQQSYQTLHLASSTNMGGDHGNGQNSTVTLDDRCDSIASTTAEEHSHSKHTGAVSRPAKLSQMNYQAQQKQLHKQAEYRKTAPNTLCPMTTDGKSHDEIKQSQSFRVIPEYPRYRGNVLATNTLQREHFSGEGKSSKLAHYSHSAFHNDTVTVSSGFPMAGEINQGISNHSINQYERTQSKAKRNTFNEKSLVSRTDNSYTINMYKDTNEIHRTVHPQTNLSNLYETSKLLTETESRASNNSLQKYPINTLGQSSISEANLQLEKRATNTHKALRTHSLSTDGDPQRPSIDRGYNYYVSQGSRKDETHSSKASEARLYSTNVDCQNHWKNNESYFDLYGPNSFEKDTKSSISTNYTKPLNGPSRPNEAVANSPQVAKSMYASEKGRQVLENTTKSSGGSMVDQRYENINVVPVPMSVEKTQSCASNTSEYISVPHQQPLLGAEQNIRCKGKTWQLSQIYPELSRGKIYPSSCETVKKNSDSNENLSKCRKRRASVRTVPNNDFETDDQLAAKYERLRQIENDYKTGNMVDHSNECPSMCRKQYVNKAPVSNADIGTGRKLVSKDDKLRQIDYDYRTSTAKTPAKHSRSEAKRSRKSSSKTKMFPSAVAVSDTSVREATSDYSDVGQTAKVESMDANSIITYCTNELNELLDTVASNNQKQPKRKRSMGQNEEGEGQNQLRRKHTQKSIGPVDATSDIVLSNVTDSNVSKTSVTMSSHIPLHTQQDTVLTQNVNEQYSHNAQTTAVTYCLVPKVPDNSVPSETLNVINVPQFVPQYKYHPVPQNDNLNQNLHNVGVQYVHIMNTNSAPNTVVQLYSANTSVQNVQEVYEV